jgi:hypothetical protein
MEGRAAALEFTKSSPLTAGDPTKVTVPAVLLNNNSFKMSVLVSLVAV